MIQKFLEAGYELVEFNMMSDVYVVNTCTVTNISDKKSRQMLRKVKQKNSNCIIVAIGCYAQVSKEELENIDEIDIVLGNNEKKDIIKYIDEYNNKRNEYINKCNVNDVSQKFKISYVSKIEKSKDFLEFGKVLYFENTRAVIKIQDGCNNFCSYCIIPYARGRIRSRNKKFILEEIRSIVDLGIKEIVLTGIHIASYGKDKEDKYYLIDLIEDIDNIEGLERIRLGSLEPNIITEEFCERLSKVKKICEHFHLSLQSGCNSTLKRMNRKYTIEEFRRNVELLRTYFKNVNLTTDIIVGFPGETEKEFEETYNFLKEINFFKMHIFKYSKRSGTVAETMENQVLENIKEYRSKKLIELSNHNEELILKRYINKSIKVLFEEEKNGFWIGHTKNYIVVKVDKSNVSLKNLQGNFNKLEKNKIYNEHNLKNLILDVKIDDLENLELIGVLKI